MTVSHQRTHLQFLRERPGLRVELPRLCGVANRASIVPRSHSRATTSAVSNVPIIVITMTMEPGMRKKWLESPGLNQ